MHATELRSVPAEELTVLPELQRKLNTARAKRIADQWDTGLLGVIEAAEFIDVDGNKFLHTIDGATRSEAARRFGEANGATVLLPVVVYTDITEKEAARLFIARNQLSSRVSAFDQHMVGLEAEDELALAIAKTIGSTKYSIGRNPAAYVVSAVGAVQSMMRRAHKIYGDPTWSREGDSLFRSLTVITQAWPLEEGDRVNGDILRGLMWMMTEYDDLDDGRLADTLSGDTPRGWASKATIVKAEETKSFSSGQRYKYLVQLWVKGYNRGITKTDLSKLG